MSGNWCKKVVMGEAMGFAAPAPLPALASVSALLDAAWKAALPGKARLGVGKRRTTRVLRRISSLRRSSLLVLFLTHREAHCLTPSGFSTFAAVSTGRCRAMPASRHTLPQCGVGTGPRHALQHHRTARTNRG